MVSMPEYPRMCVCLQGPSGLYVIAKNQILQPQLNLKDRSNHSPHSPSCAPFQTILVGDSGVGKTSLLVQFDQGKFIPGSFSATVGIGFTVSSHQHFGGPVCLYQDIGKNTRALWGPFKVAR